MPEAGKHNDHYSLEAIEAYLTGKLSPAEMHAMEKAALQDPFLADAIEGFREADLMVARRHLGDAGQHILAAAPQASVVMPARRNNFWRVAAAVILIAGAATIALLINNSSKVKPELAKTTSLPSDESLASALPKKDSTIVASAPVNDNTFNAKQKPAPQLKKEEREKIAAALTADGMAAKKKSELEAVAMAARNHAATLSQQSDISKTMASPAPVTDTSVQRSVAMNQRTFTAARKATDVGALQSRRFGNNAAAKKEAEAPAAAAALPPPPYLAENIVPLTGWDSLYHLLSEKIGAAIKQTRLPDATVVLQLNDKGFVSEAEVGGWPPAAAAALARALKSGPQWLTSGQTPVAGEKKILISSSRIQQWPLK